MKRNIIAVGIVAILFGCNQQKADYAGLEKEAFTDTLLSDTTAGKIIKTADMRFRVQDVQKTKEQLSTAIKQEGGTLTEFNIQSSLQQSEKVRYSPDSLKEITSYRKEAYLVAKIPSEKLDDFTNAVAKMAVFVDEQSLKMDDQRIHYLSNKLKAQNRIEAVNRINKVASKKSTNVESSLLIKDDYIDKTMQNLDIDNRVKYSTITLNFYQPNTISTWVVGNDRLYDYRPGFFKQLWLNFLSGWTLFKEIILGLANLWTLLVLAAALFCGIRYYKKRRRAVS